MYDLEVGWRKSEVGEVNVSRETFISKVRNK